MMGHRFLVATNLLLTCVTYVKAQWILDNRCSRRRNLGQRESPVQNASSIGILQPEHQGYEYDRNPRESYDQLDSIADTSNVTESEGDFWYHNLRGYRRSPSTSQTGAVVVAADIKRRHLFREDPSSFMMRLHWQPGNCWQGKNGLGASRLWVKDKASLASVSNCLPSPSLNYILSFREQANGSNENVSGRKLKMMMSLLRTEFLNVSFCICRYRVHGV